MTSEYTHEELATIAIARAAQMRDRRERGAATLETLGRRLLAAVEAERDSSALAEKVAERLGWA